MSGHAEQGLGLTANHLAQRLVDSSTLTGGGHCSPSMATLLSQEQGQGDSRRGVQVIWDRTNPDVILWGNRSAAHPSC